ncbi:MAG: NAD-dependent deacetylase [Bacteroidia bacterium]|nr:NAD-dependent deacetylase [Bacteroidia bacterium]
MTNIDDNIKEAAECVKKADALLITAGAGMGVDSGLPDFRGNQGFWNAYPAFARLGKSFSQMANPQWFDTNPRLAWAFYGHRLNLYRTTVPHKGFNQLLEIGKVKKGGYFVFTSNVDGQFQKAGFEEELIEECHGSIHHFQCVTPCSSYNWNAGNVKIRIDEDTFKAIEPLPECPNCGKLARPNILMFGDWTWIQDRTADQGERLYQWLNKNKNYNLKLVIIELGAGTAVATVRYQSEGVASRYGGTLIRINPRDFDVPAGHISLPFGAAEGIEKIFQAL